MPKYYVISDETIPRASVAVSRDSRKQDRDRMGSITVFKYFQDTWKAIFVAFFINICISLL